MSDTKRYGAIPDRHPAGDDGFEGWTLDKLANTGRSAWTDTYLVRELARDLIAAQARIAQLESHVAELQAEVDAQPVTIRTRPTGDYREQLEAAQATIERARALPSRRKRAKGKVA